MKKKLQKCVSISLLYCFFTSSSSFTTTTTPSHTHKCPQLTIIATSLDLWQAVDCQGSWQFATIIGIQITRGRYCVAFQMGEYIHWLWIERSWDMIDYYLHRKTQAKLPHNLNTSKTFKTYYKPYWRSWRTFPIHAIYYENILFMPCTLMMIFLYFSSKA